MAEAARNTVFMSAEDYLAQENDGAWKHEFVNGAVYAMVGSSDRHNLISVNLAGILSDRLPDGCQVFAVDMKAHIRQGRDERFYYPDVFVSCAPTDRARYTRNEPIFIAEVLSPGTERIDRGEKFEAYTGIASLQEYALLSQDEPKLELFRRGTGFDREAFGPNDDVTLECLGLTFSLAALYRRISF